MSIHLRKIEYAVHMDRLDEKGNVIDELSTQQPLSLYPHQLGDLTAQVAAVIAQAQAQADDQLPGPPSGDTGKPVPKPRTRPRR